MSKNDRLQWGVPQEMSKMRCCRWGIMTSKNEMSQRGAMCDMLHWGASHIKNETSQRGCIAEDVEK